MSASPVGKDLSERSTRGHNSGRLHHTKPTPSPSPSADRAELHPIVPKIHASPSENESSFSPVHGGHGS